jgi:hypothetical protein
VVVVVGGMVVVVGGRVVVVGGDVVVVGSVVDVVAVVDVVTPGLCFGCPFPVRSETTVDRRRL